MKGIAVGSHFVCRMTRFDLTSTRNSRACAAHSGLHAEAWQHPAVQDDPHGEKADDDQSVFHGSDFLKRTQNWRNHFAQAAVEQVGETVPSDSVGSFEAVHALMPPTRSVTFVRPLDFNRLQPIAER